ncbi:MAG: urease accessory protein UreD [Elainellaceae cyanobacterium]
MTVNDTALNSDLSLAQGWSGALHLFFARRRNATKIVHRYTQSPFKLQRPFYPEGPDVCHSVMLHTAGGLVGGDRLQVDLTLDSEAQALVTSAAASKVYRSAGAPAQQRINIAIGPNACLEWFPQETILFDGAHYRQHLQVSLAKNAMLTGWDIVRLGRSARQETFQHGTWRTLTAITQDECPIWIDPQSLTGGSDLLAGPTGMADHPVVATFFAIGRDVPRSLVEACRQWPEAAGCEADLGATRLISGLLCRYRGSSTAQAKQWFEYVWGLTRHYHSGRAICRPRVWP